jgi:hypothetical protein
VTPLGVVTPFPVLPTGWLCVASGPGKLATQSFGALSWQAEPETESNFGLLQAVALRRNRPRCRRTKIVLETLERDARFMQGLCKVVQAHAMQLAGPIRRKSLQELRFEPLAGQGSKKHCTTLQDIAWQGHGGGPREPRAAWASRAPPPPAMRRANLRMLHSVEPAWRTEKRGGNVANCWIDRVAWDTPARRVLEGSVCFADRLCVHIYSIAGDLSSPNVGRAAFFPEAHLASPPRVSELLKSRYHDPAGPHNRGCCPGRGTRARPMGAAEGRTPGTCRFDIMHSEFRRGLDLVPCWVCW